VSGPPAAQLDWVRAGTVAFESAVDALAGTDLPAPSSLPGWSRRHVIAHVAGNADALVNLVDWAATGVETPMYASAGQRSADIDAWAARPDADLRAHLVGADGRLAAALDALPDDRWSVQVRTARGRLVTASEIPWMRVREVWVHRVDLGVGVTVADFPAGIVQALIGDAVTGFGSGTAAPPVELVPTDAPSGWRIGPRDAPTRVSGTRAALAGYLIGRPGGALAADPEPIPRLPAWL
jgi:maleylpyruvate isomerase